MTTTLITGGNKGLGYEAARRLLAEGHDVWIGARDAGRGEKAAADLGARFVQLDVTDDASVAAAVATVGALDVLVNNAGIALREADPDDPTSDELGNLLETNLLGAVRVFHAFRPLLEASDNGVVVNVSSGLGSISGTLLGTYPARPVSYSVSKAALNMLTVQWAMGLPQLRVNVVDPGYTATDLNAHSGPQTVTEGTDAIVAMAVIGADGPTGTYTDRSGTVAW